MVRGTGKPLGVIQQRKQMGGPTLARNTATGEVQFTLVPPKRCMLHSWVAVLRRYEYSQYRAG